jgi:hypothetical protein
MSTNGVLGSARRATSDEVTIEYCKTMFGDLKTRRRSKRHEVGSWDVYLEQTIVLSHGCIEHAREPVSHTVTCSLAQPGHFPLFRTTHAPRAESRFRGLSSSAATQLYSPMLMPASGQGDAMMLLAFCAPCVRYTVPEARAFAAKRGNVSPCASVDITFLAAV